MILAVVQHFASEADIALRSRSHQGADPIALAKKAEAAIKHLATIEKFARRQVGRPERSERPRQARALEMTFDAHLASKRGSLLSHQDLEGLARGFVMEVWADRSMPITRELTRKRLLNQPFDKKAIDVVREAFAALPPSPNDRHDSQAFIRAGLRALGVKNARGLFDFEAKEAKRSRG